MLPKLQLLKCSKVLHASSSRKQFLLTGHAKFYLLYRNVKHVITLGYIKIYWVSISVQIHYTILFWVCTGRSRTCRTDQYVATDGILFLLQLVSKIYHEQKSVSAKMNLLLSIPLLCMNVFVLEWCSSRYVVGKDHQYLGSYFIE